MSGVALRPDVRLIEAGGRTGLQRGTQIAWMPERLCRGIWSLGPSTFGEDVAQALVTLGLAADAHGDEAAGRTDRNRVFADALCRDEGARSLAALASTTIVLAGCGGLGSNAAVILAALGARKLVLVDGDVIEESNLNRLPWADRSHVGGSKVEALAEHLERRYSVAASAVRAYVDEATPRMLRAQGVASDAIWLVLIDEAAAARTCVSELFALAGQRRGFGTLLHAGYVDRHCIAGPLASDVFDPCPFCCQAPPRIVSRSYVAPSAAPNNLLIASFLAAQLLLHIGRGSSALHRHRWRFDLMTGASESTEVRKDPTCPTCSNARG